MKPKTLAILGIVTLAAAGLAAYTLTQQSERVAARDEGGPAFPRLADQANDAAQVHIVKGTEELTLTRGEAGWGIAQRGGYPAKVEEVKGLIVALAELQFTEPRTRNPASYSQIGVQDPAAGAESSLVEVRDAAGEPLAGLIIGNNKPGTGFIAEATFYARRAGEEQSWVAKPGRGTQRVEAYTDPMQWVERNVLGIGKERVKSAQITHADGVGNVLVTKEAKESTEFHLAEMPEGRELLFPTSPERVASALAFVTMDEVKPAAERPMEDATVTAEYRTFDGLVVSVRAAKSEEDKSWAAFAVRAEDSADESVKKEAAELLARLSPWVFQVPEFQAKNFMSRMSDLLKPLPGEALPNAPEGIEAMNIPGLTTPPPGPLGPMGPEPTPPKPEEPKPEGPPPTPVAPPR